jgi:hypothetical protein
LVIILSQFDASLLIIIETNLRDFKWDQYSQNQKMVLSSQWLSMEDKIDNAEIHYEIDYTELLAMISRLTEWHH